MGMTTIIIEWNMRPRVILLIMVMLPLLVVAKSKTNSEQARQIFDKSYNMVFGPQGSTLHYDVNIIGIYKTQGTICFKGKKQRFTDERVDTWNDGVTAYMAYRKKKTVEIHNANSDKKDKYSGKFKFTLDDFTYSMQKEGDDLVLTLKQKKGAKGTIKEVKATVDPKTYEPKYLKLKVAFIWAKIQISKFKSGGISDAVFVFPKERYASGWKFEDKR